MSSEAGDFLMEQSFYRCYFSLSSANGLHGFDEHDVERVRILGSLEGRHAGEETRTKTMTPNAYRLILVYVDA